MEHILYRQKPNRLLPTNLYVVLFNFIGRQTDELDLKWVNSSVTDRCTFSQHLLCIRAGYKVTVIDSSDSDWWKGKCLGKIGYFPSKYVAKLAPNEKPLQVTHNLQISETEGGLNKLLRHQVSFIFKYYTLIRNIIDIIYLNYRSGFYILE